MDCIFLIIHRSQLIQIFIVVTIAIFSGTMTFASESCRGISPASQNMQSIAQIVEPIEECEDQECLPKERDPQKRKQSLSLPPVTFSAMGAESATKNLFQRGQIEVKRLMDEDDGCAPPCKRKTAASLHLTSTPTAFESTDECPRSPRPISLTDAELKAVGDQAVRFQTADSAFTINFKGSSASKCEGEAKKWVEKTLRGKNDLGNYLEEKKCPSPCSYSSLAKFTPREIGDSGCNLNVHLIINCTPPKKKFEWKSHLTIKSDWTCAKETR